MRCQRRGGATGRTFLQRAESISSVYRILRRARFSRVCINRTPLSTAVKPLPLRSVAADASPPSPPPSSPSPSPSPSPPRASPSILPPPPPTPRPQAIPPRPLGHRDLGEPRVRQHLPRGGPVLGGKVQHGHQKVRHRRGVGVGEAVLFREHVLEGPKLERSNVPELAIPGEEIAAVLAVGAIRLGIRPMSSIISARWSSSRSYSLPLLGSKRRSPVASSNAMQARDHTSAGVEYLAPRITSGTGTAGSGCLA